MTDFTIAENWKTMWDSAFPGSQARELTRQGVRAHWDAQQRILNTLEDYANGWFDRRETGVRAAAEAAQGMCNAPSFAEIFAAWQTWVAGAAERLATDGLAWQQCLAACSVPLAPRDTEARKAKGSKTARDLPKAA